jgi:hypothetical protein
MTIKVHLTDSKGNSKGVRISEEGALQVVAHPHPPSVESLSSIPYREYFKNGASSDMRVNGSTTNVEFSINADQKKDLYIKTISVVISDSGATLSKFGNISALSEGVEIKWQTSELGTTIIADALKTNFDFVRMGLGEPAFGDGTTAFRGNNVSGSSEAYIPVIDFQKLFGISYGLRLRKGSTDKLVFTIKDNVSTIDQFDAIAYGIKI